MKRNPDSITNFAVCHPRPEKLSGKFIALFGLWVSKSDRNLLYSKFVGFLSLLYSKFWKLTRIYYIEHILNFSYVIYVVKLILINSEKY